MSNGHGSLSFVMPVQPNPAGRGMSCFFDKYSMMIRWLGLEYCLQGYVFTVGTIFGVALYMNNA